MEMLLEQIEGDVINNEIGLVGTQLCDGADGNIVDAGGVRSIG